MPIIYTIDVRRALIVTRCFGHVTLAEVQEHFEELARVWPAVDKLDVLLDLTEQTSLPTLRDLEEVATEIDAQIGRRSLRRCHRPRPSLRVDANVGSACRSRSEEHTSEL